MFTRIICFLVIPIALSGLLWVFLNDRKKTVSLVIGVLSSRYHFEERNVIRETWAKLNTSIPVKIVFLVGHEDCEIPFEERISPFDCQPISLAGIQLAGNAATANFSAISPSHGFCGFSFRVIIFVVVTLFNLCEFLSGEC